MKEVETLYLLDMDDTLIRTTEKVKPFLLDHDKNDLSIIKGDDDNIFPDAKELLDQIEENEIPAIIYTYGDEEWQTKKHADLLNKPNIPMFVTDREDKCRQLGERYNGIVHMIGDYAAKNIVMIDDKKKSFEDSSNLQNATMYYVERNLKDQPEELESGVITIQSLDEIDRPE